MGRWLPGGTTLSASATSPAGLDLTLVFKLSGRRYVSGDGNCENNEPCTYSTIQSALDAAENGDLIGVEQGTYEETPMWSTPGTVSINGGWNQTFTGQTGTTTMYAPGATGGSTVKLLPNIGVVPQP